MLENTENFKTIRWDELNLNYLGIADHIKKEWDHRWQEGFSHPVTTFTTYQHRAFLLHSIRAEFKTFIEQLISKLYYDAVWSSTDNVLFFEDVMLQRLPSSAKYHQFKARLKSFELIHMIQKYDYNQTRLFTPLAVIIRRMDNACIPPIFAMAAVRDLSPDYTSFPTVLCNELKCQRQVTTGRMYFLGVEEYNDLMIPLKNEIYLRPEFILHSSINKFSITESGIEKIIREKLKSTARALDRLRLNVDTFNVITRGQLISRFLHQYGLNCRYLGQIQLWTKRAPTRLCLLHELICRSVKYLLNRSPTEQFLLNLENGICNADICAVILQRFEYQVTEQECQIVSRFVQSEGFWERLADDSNHRVQIDCSFGAVARRFCLAAETQCSSLPVITELITYDPIWMNSDLISVDSGLERLRQYTAKSFGINHIVNAELLANRSHYLTLLMYHSVDYTYHQVQRIVQEARRIAAPHLAKFIALSNSAVTLSYLQKFRAAFAIVNSIESCQFYYLTASAQVQYNRGLLHDYANTLKALLRCSVCVVPTEVQLDILLKLITSYIRLNKFRDASALLLRTKAQLSSAPKPVFLVRFLLCLSKCYEILGDYAVALSILRKCRGIAAKELIGSDRLHLVYVCMELAELYLNHYKSAKTAVQLLLTSIKEFQTLHDSQSNDRSLLDLLRRLGKALSLSGNQQLADRMLRVSVIRGQALINSNSANMFEVCGFVEIASSYAELEETAKCSDLWLQALNRISSSSNLYHTYDCMTVFLNYSKNVDEPERLVEILQSALHYATLIYTDQHDVPTKIQLRIAQTFLNMHRDGEADEILANLHRRLNSASDTRNSDVHIQCWTLQAHRLYMLRQYFELKTFLDERLRQIENADALLLVITPESLFGLFSVQMYVNHKLCGFSETHLILERARILSTKLFPDSVAGQVILRMLASLFAGLRRFDLARDVIVEVWECCRLMAFHEQFLQSDVLRIRSSLWFLEFAQSTIVFSNILAQDRMFGLAFRSLQDVLEMLLPLNQEIDGSQDIINQLLFAQAQLMFRKQDSREEARILMQFLKQFQKEGMTTALVYCRLASIWHDVGDNQQRLRFLGLAISTLTSIDTNKSKSLLAMVRRALKSAISIDFKDFCKLNIYDLNPLPNQLDNVLPLSAATRSENLLLHRQHILKQLQFFELSVDVRHDYIAMALIELARSYADEKMFSEATACISRVRSITKYRKLQIHIPDLQLERSTSVLKLNSNKQNRKKANRSTAAKRKRNKFKCSPYLYD